MLSLIPMAMCIINCDNNKVEVCALLYLTYQYLLINPMTIIVRV